MTLKVVRWIVLAAGAGLAAIALIAAAGSRTATLRQLVIDTLEDRLDSEVELQSFSVDLVPAVMIRGSGLVVRHRGRRDVPPLVAMQGFTIQGGILGLVRRPRTFDRVVLDRLAINIPPGGIDTGDRDSEDDSNEPDPGTSPIIVRRLQADDATLSIIPRREGKEPKVFLIHRLELESVGAASRMPFKADLTNPIPKGLIQTSGTFGPWHKRSPAKTPLDGRYTFDKADLGTIKGIGGILDSSGEFDGRLERIAVRGTTTTPDFHVDVSGNPVALSTRFDAVVDGTDGDTYLNDVYATFGKTSLTAKGAVAGTKGVKGRTIGLNVQIKEGRIEDLLRLSVKGDTPLMTGSVALHTDFTLPPGEADVVERLRLAGEFDLDAARFTDPQVQSKLSGMSQRARGKDPDERAASVVSDLSGKFRLQSGALSLANLSFAIPGATVRLAGTYGLRSEELAFDGTLRMQATISEAAGGGLKGFLLKAVDPLFRKGNAGAVVPIKVRGTRSEPKFGVDVVKVITPR